MGFPKENSMVFRIGKFEIILFRPADLPDMTIKEQEVAAHVVTPELRETFIGNILQVTCKRRGTLSIHDMNGFPGCNATGKLVGFPAAVADYSTDRRNRIVGQPTRLPVGKLAADITAADPETPVVDTGTLAVPSLARSRLGAAEHIRGIGAEYGETLMKIFDVQ